MTINSLGWEYVRMVKQKATISFQFIFIIRLLQELLLLRSCNLCSSRLSNLGRAALGSGKGENFLPFSSRELHATPAFLNTARPKLLTLMNLLMIEPGWMDVTLTPLPTVSSLKLWVSPSTKNFVAVYTASPGNPWKDNGGLKSFYAQVYH